MSRRCLLVVVGAVLASGAADSRQASSSGRCIAHWRVLVRPAANLSAVAALSRSDVWAVGWRGATAHGVIAHWDGANLRLSVTRGRRMYLGIAAVSPADVWAVGSEDVAGNRSRGVIEHWNGRRWRRLRPRGVSAVDDIVMQSPSQGWAVGATTDLRPVVLRWNGRFWKKRIFFHRGYEGWFSAVSATSANDVWPVGQRAGEGSVNSQDGFVVHRNGRRWKVGPAPVRDDSDLGYESSDEFDDVAGVSRSEAWAIHSGVARSDRTAVAGASSASSVKGSSSTESFAFPGEAWALGGRSGRPFLIHWDGRSWRPFETALGRGELTAAASLSAQMIWAVGTRLFVQYGC